MAQSPEEKKSVQVLPDDSGAGGMLEAVESIMLHFAADTNCVPAWWSKSRDAWLRNFVRDEGNDLLAGAVATLVAKVATANWYLEGPERTANIYRDVLLQKSEFGGGWSQMIQRWTWDYLTQDQGGWIERIRVVPESGRQGGALGFASFDNARMRLTGNPQHPAIYVDTNGDDHKLTRPQFLHIVDSPAPDEAKYGVGYCATSRAVTTANILMAIAKYEREKLSDLPPLGLLLINNMTPEQWKDVEKQYQMAQRQQGNTVYRDLLTAFGLDPSLPLQAELLSFSQLPEQFDKRAATEIAVYSFALAFRVDPRELWPVSSGTLGTATEAEIMHVKAKAKGHGLILTDIERGMNDGYSLPPTLTFHFDFVDTEEDQQAAEIANIKAEFITKLTKPDPATGEGLVSRAEGRAWLVRQGLFDEQELMTYQAEETAMDVEEAKSLVDMGPRVRVFSDGRSPMYLDRRSHLWPVVRQMDEAGRVQPKGKPLPEWREGRQEKITPDDVARAMRAWDRDMPPEYRGLLNAEAV